MLFAAFGLATAALSPATAAVQTGAGDAADTLRTEGQANKAKVVTRPDFINGPPADLPASEKALGHHGLVVIEGVVGSDGRMHAASVKTSSGVPTLDAIALAAAQGSTFTPAKDAAGAALPVLISMPFEFAAYRSATGGIYQYKCDQFVRDMDWWRQANPQKPYKEHELYKILSGFRILALLRSAGGDHTKVLKAINGFETKWNAAIELCRRKPTMLQKDAIYR